LARYLKFFDLHFSIKISLFFTPVQTTRSKQKVTDQKIQQAEEAFSHAKQLYDEITDDLYEELPAFYDR
jgi:hypothetical protein